MCKVGICGKVFFWGRPARIQTRIRIVVGPAQDRLNRNRDALRNSRQFIHHKAHRASGTKREKGMLEARNQRSSWLVHEGVLFA
jgi:hypothetical protein